MNSKSDQEIWNDIVKELEKIMLDKYGKTVIEHANHPKNIGKLIDANSYASLTGECGDTIEMWLKITNGTIDEIAFSTDGCATTKASGSMVTELAKGKKIEDALEISPLQVLEALGGLPEESTHCAFLATNTLHEAIKKFQRNR